MNDPINPQHYKSESGLECIDAIKAQLSPEEFRGYLRGCAAKYCWRIYNKGEASENLEKAIWYLNRLHKEIEHAQA